MTSPWEKIHILCCTKVDQWTHWESYRRCGIYKVYMFQSYDAMCTNEHGRNWRTDGKSLGQTGARSARIELVNVLP